MRPWTELPCRCDRLGKRLGGNFLKLGFQTRFIDRSVQTGIAAVSHRTDDRCHARERPALAADLPCVFRRLNIVYAAQNILDRNIIIRIIDRERELFTLIERLAFYGDLHYFLMLYARNVSTKRGRHGVEPQRSFLLFSYLF